MKVITTIKWLAVFVTVAILLVLFCAYLSSSMQGYYKGQIDDFTKETSEIEALLNKKAAWAEFGEGILPICISVGGAAIITGTALGISRTKKKKGNTEK